MKNGLVKCRDYIFNFLEDPLIPSDNNAIRALFQGMDSIIMGIAE